MPDANAWRADVIWGASSTQLGLGGAVEWGVIQNASARWSVASPSENVVWGNTCGGADCGGNWYASAASVDGDTVVWGSNDDGDTVVWGSSCDDPSCATVVWGRP